MQHWLLVVLAALVGVLAGAAWGMRRASILRAELAVAHERVAQMKERMEQWETEKQRFVEAARGAALSASRELSGKLLEDHQREREAAHKATEEITRKTTAALTERFEGIVHMVAALNGQVSDAKGRVDTVWQALTSPGGAGHFAEVGLENMLKTFGLQPGRDFVMQYTLQGEEGRLRPDAVLFLPGETLMVIDSKASKFLVDAASAEEGADTDAEHRNLARSMNQHLKNLMARDYKAAIQQAYKAAGRGSHARRVISVMYLPSESAFEGLAQADGEFLAKAHRADIMVAGPFGLSSLVGLVSREIDLARQAENHEKIVDAVEDLLEAVAVALGYANKMGRGLRQALDGFNDFVASTNRRLLPRARGLAAFGVRPGRNKELPEQLVGFHVVPVGEPPLIGVEAEDAVA